MNHRAVLVILISALLGGAFAADAPKPAPADAQDLLYLGDPRPLFIRLRIQVDGRPYRTAFRSAWDESVRRLFRHLDRDGDGALTEAEAERAPTPQLLFAGGQPDEVNVAFNFRAIDDNGDSRISPAELAEYYRFYGGGAFAVQHHPSQLLVPDSIHEALFNRLDADKDGALSKVELAAAATTLLKSDLDDDETLTPAELVPSLVPRPDQPVNPAARRPRPAESPFIVLAPGDPPDRWTGKLLARYGGDQKDGKLSREDLALDPITFAALDGDKDGRLNVEELARFTDRTPDVELVLRFGKSAAGEQRLEVTPVAGLAGVVQKAKGEAVRFDFEKAQITFRRQGGPSVAEAVAATRQYYLRQFQDADIDKNNRVDRKEVTQNRPLARVFDLLDRDGDGQVREDEATAYLDQVQVLQIEALASRPVLVLSAEGRGLFDLLDRDRDGRLGVRELRGATEVLTALDRDGNGLVGREEVPKSYQLVLGRGQASLNALAARPAASALLPGLSAGPGPVWFRKMDRNGDGDVSAREFLGPMAEFKKLDTDGDGFLSLEEAEKADAAMRRPKSEPG